MGFKWIAAGSAYATFSNINLYVKFKQRKGPYDELYYPHGFLVKLQDREIFITRQGGKDYNFVFPMTGYDFCINADLLGLDSAVKHTGIMFAYEESKSKKDFRYDKSSAMDNIYSDSGGFQILSGVFEFVNPIKLAHWYNQAVTHGMALDIPLGLGSSKEFIVPTAKIQKENLKIIKDHCDESVQIYNVSHGVSPETRRQFIDLVHRDDINLWAIGCPYFGNVFDLITNMYSVFTHIPAESYHVFGVAATHIIPILAWVGRYRNITSDSSSHLQSGLSFGMYNLSGYLLKNRRMGSSRDEFIQTDGVHPYIPCSCNLCHALGTSELIYNVRKTVVGHTICSLHNLNQIAKYAELWSDLAKKSTLNEYKRYISKIVPKLQKSYWISALNYIEELENSPYDKTIKKFTGYRTLFYSGFNASNESLFTNDKSISISPDSLNNRIARCIAKFQSFFKDKENFKAPKKKVIKKDIEDTTSTAHIGIKSVLKKKRAIKRRKSNA